MQQSAPLIALDGIGKSFGAVRALDDVSLPITGGRVLAVMGHNGAGKSTLMNILTGVIHADRGRIRIAGEDVTDGYGVGRAYSLGIRCVFQELSLCGNLSVAENTKIYHHDLGGLGWRRRSSELIMEKLGEIFPGHRIDPGAIVEDLPIAERQMVEISRAFTETAAPARLIILDEPTSALDPTSARQLLSYVQRCSAERGLAILFISHKMIEVSTHSDDVLVMKDGRTVGQGLTAELGEARIIEMMGMVEAPAAHRDVSARSLGERERVRHGRFTARAGEIVGLAGLAGHGQRRMLQLAFDGGGTSGMKVDGSVAYVAGDRQTEGVFPLWSVKQNISAGLRSDIARFGCISPAREQAMAEKARDSIGIKAASLDAPITTLSGGNQQKVLVARAFAHDADVVILDDPLRGVDLGTKRDLYAQIRTAADRGVCFLWYTTETAELENCDVVYVFNAGEITDVIPRAELSEERVLAASFAEGESRGH